MKTLLCNMCTICLQKYFASFSKMLWGHCQILSVTEAIEKCEIKQHVVIEHVIFDVGPKYFYNFFYHFH